MLSTGDQVCRCLTLQGTSQSSHRVWSDVCVPTCLCVEARSQLIASLLREGLSLNRELAPAARLAGSPQHWGYMHTLHPARCATPSPLCVQPLLQHTLCLDHTTGQVSLQAWTWTRQRGRVSKAPTGSVFCNSAILQMAGCQMLCDFTFLATNCAGTRLDPTAAVLNCHVGF